jgi:hypothetical protein
MRAGASRTPRLSQAAQCAPYRTGFQPERLANIPKRKRIVALRIDPCGGVAEDLAPPLVTSRSMSSEAADRVFQHGEHELFLRRKARRAIGFPELLRQ